MRCLCSLSAFMLFGFYSSEAPVKDRKVWLDGVGGGGMEGGAVVVGVCVCVCVWVGVCV